MSTTAMSSIPFWGTNPSVLMNKTYILELWPSSEMCYEQKMNAITRLVIVLTMLGYLMTLSSRVLMVGILTIVIMYIMYQSKIGKSDKNQKVNDWMNSTEGFGNGLSTNFQQVTITNPATLETTLKSDYKEGDKKNPFSNVLLTEINGDPDRNAAPPSFNLEVESDITKNVK
jgi:hypothetical protein